MTAKKIPDRRKTLSAEHYDVLLAKLDASVELADKRDDINLAQHAVLTKGNDENKVLLLEIKQEQVVQREAVQPILDARRQEDERRVWAAQWVNRAMVIFGLIVAFAGSLKAVQYIVYAIRHWTK